MRKRRGTEEKGLISYYQNTHTENVTKRERSERKAEISRPQETHKRREFVVIRTHPEQRANKGEERQTKHGRSTVKVNFSRF